MRITAIVALVLTASTAAAQNQRATLVLTNGRIVTVDSSKPEAQAVAVAGDRIIAVGTNAEIQRFVTPQTRVIDLNGRLAIPGFIEGHGHFSGLGEAKLQLDLTQVKNWDEIVEMVRVAATKAKPGEWILGRGWHQEKWDRVPAGAVEGNPVHATLSAASPNNPVQLTHASGHGAFVNAKAMELAGITRTTANPEGGEIVRDAQGNATGLLRETAQRMTGAARNRAAAGRTAADVDARNRQVVKLAGEDAVSKGITSFHDAGSSFGLIDFYKKLADEGNLPLRLYVMVRREPFARMDSLLPKYKMVGYANNFLTVRSIKRQIDGALGSHGAWLHEPYVDLPRSTGLVLERPSDIDSTAMLAIKYGYQVNTHAIGDRANYEVLNIYEQHFRANPDKKDLRWRIEHAQHIHPDDIPRFKKLGVIASMEGIHAVSDGPWIEPKLGPQRTKAESYVFRQLWDLGTVIMNGTDVPVEDADPIASFYGTVSRVTKPGWVFLPEQKLTREEALKSYTLNGAYGAFMEKDLGSISVGKLADIAVLSKDIMRVPEKEIPTARVVYTIIGGKVAYMKEPQIP
jgi:predicted amidohydrolase YtcJ